MEDDFHFRKVCEKEGYSSSEGLRMAMKALQYMSENGLTYCLTENKNDDLLNYCLTKNTYKIVKDRLKHHKISLK